MVKFDFFARASKFNFVLSSFRVFVIAFCFFDAKKQITLKSYEECRQLITKNWKNI
jgi:hypothetical protein